MSERTVDTIIESLSEGVSSGNSISPDLYVKAAEFLTILVGNETDKLYILEQQVAQAKLKALEESKSVSEAKLKVEATDLYREARIQKAKIDQVYEFIRIAKLTARLKNDERMNP